MDPKTDGELPLDPDTVVVTPRGGKSRRVTIVSGTEARIDGESWSYRVLSSCSSGDGFVAILGGRVFRVSRIESDPNDRGEIRITVDGAPWSGRVDDKQSLLIRRVVDRPESGSGPRTVKAPMPGLVLRTLVSAGDVVAAGQPLLLLEAMKMENEIRCDKDGMILRVHVSSGQAVEKGDVLLELK